MAKQNLFSKCGVSKCFVIERLDWAHEKLHHLKKSVEILTITKKTRAIVHMAFLVLFLSNLSPDEKIPNKKPHYALLSLIIIAVYQSLFN